MYRFCHSLMEVYFPSLINLSQLKCHLRGFYTAYPNPYVGGNPLTFAVWANYDHTVGFAQLSPDESGSGTTWHTGTKDYNSCHKGCLL